MTTTTEKVDMIRMTQGDHELFWVKLIPGKRGDMIGIIQGDSGHAGKICMPTYNFPEVEGYLLVYVSQHKERVCFGTPSEYNFVGADSGGWAHWVAEPRVFTLAEAPTCIVARQLHERYCDELVAAEQVKIAARAAEEALQTEAAAYGSDALAFYLLLKQHDWYYAYSDDGNVWRKGQAEREAITAKASRLHPKIVHIIWAMKAPADCSCPV